MFDDLSTTHYLLAPLQTCSDLKIEKRESVVRECCDQVVFDLDMYFLLKMTKILLLV